MPKFSVVTSFFGEGKNYVERVYSDLCSQEVDFEWVVTDDFSSDAETRRTLRKLAKVDTRVKYIDQNEKREIYRDPQHYATGEFVFHLDADDRVHPNYLKHCEYWFNRFPLVNCILSGSEWVHENGRFNRFHYHMKDDLFSGGKHNFIGRIWRNGFDFKFKEIFSNYDDVIRMNDMFVVKSFETTGDILCLPRVYIRYEMRATSNSTIKRSPEEAEKIKRCSDEFTYWLSQNIIESPYDPFFFESEVDIIPFLALKWESEKQTLHHCGRKFPPHKGRKIRELYQDYAITLGKWVGEQDPDYRIIDCSNNFEKHPLTGNTNIIVCKLNDEKCFEYYQKQLLAKGLVFRWINLWDYKWMITI